jgi:flagellar protein FliO/FliZ
VVTRIVLLAAAALAAAAPGALAAEAAPGPGLGSVLQVTLGLGVVLAMVAAAAWLVRRLGAGAGLPEGVVRVRGGIAVGQRERVVVVEVRDTWLVIGVAPGAVRTLHALPKPPETDGAGGAPQPAEASFARWLTRALEKPR